MKRRWWIALLFPPAIALAQAHSEQETKKDIERHRQMAEPGSAKS